MLMAHNPMAGRSELAGIRGVEGESTPNSGAVGHTISNGHAGVAGACDQGLGYGLHARSANLHGQVPAAVSAQPGKKHRKCLVSPALAMTLVVFVTAAMAQVAGASDILWHNSSTGESQIWSMDGQKVSSRATVVGQDGKPVFVGLPWSLVGIRSDATEFGQPDIVWHNSATNETQLWSMFNQKVIERPTVLGEDGKPIFVGLPWSIVGAGDFYHDLRDDIVWHNSATGETQLWLMDGSRVTGRATVLGEDGKAAFVGPPWSIVGAGNFNGRDDIVWYNSATGETQLWLMDIQHVTGRATVLGQDGKPALVGPPWSIVGIKGFTRDRALPVQLSVRQDDHAGGTRVTLYGANFTAGSHANIQFKSDYSGQDDFGFSVQVQPDGTFIIVQDLGCGRTGPRGQMSFAIRATDGPTGRTTQGSVAYICSQTPPPPPTPPPPTKPSLTSVTQQGLTFYVRGSGFLPSHTVHIRVASNAPGAPPNGVFFTYSSDASGGINAGITIPCLSGIQLYFSANDERSDAQDLTGTLWSNTVTVTCS
jgi:hypothetical protein